MLEPVFLAAALLLLGAFVRLNRRYKALSGKMSRTQSELEVSRGALKHLQYRDGLRDEFISTASHELRTPLTSIRGALGLLSSGVLGKVDDRAANLLRIASSNTDRLVRLINDILDLQRMESGAAPLPMLSCSVDELLRHAVETMGPMADAAEVQLTLQPGTTGDGQTVEGNPDRLHQVLCNLLSNAIKFSQRHGLVSLGTSVEGETLSIRVEDRGRGVPADKLESIFDRFGQVESSDFRQKGGTGLGLAICRTIITQHGGTIHAQRNDDAVSGLPGATLVIRLPLGAAKPVTSPALYQLLA